MSKSGREFPPELLARFAEMIVPLQCTVVIEVREDGKYRREDRGTPIRCGKPLHPGLGCREKFQWGGTHAFAGDPRKDMVFRPVTIHPGEGDNPPSVSLNLDDVDYKPHPVLDGGVGSGGKRTLADGDSGVRRRVVIDGESESVIRFLPAEFLHGYEQLLDVAYGESRLAGTQSGSTQGSPAKKSSGRVSSNDTEHTLMASGGARKAPREIQFKSEQAVDFRKKIDRKIRRLGREIKEFLAGGEDQVKSGKRRCGGRCRKIGDPEWMYCPRCGGPMEEVN